MVVSAYFSGEFLPSLLLVSGVVAQVANDMTLPSLAKGVDVPRSSGDPLENNVFFGWNRVERKYGGFVKFRHSRYIYILYIIYIYILYIEY